MGAAKWTDADIERLKELYPHMQSQKVAEILGCKLKRINSKAHELGLKKTPEYLSSPEAGRIPAGSDIGAKTRFPKGIKPWNTGKKGWQAGGRSKETQFKPGELKGQALLNYAPIGSERVNKDGVLERKVSDTGRKRWKSVHTIVWEEEHGPMPKGYIVVFRNGNREDIRRENLELISRGENMQRNSRHNRYPEELNQVMHLRGLLTRKINKRLRDEK